MRPIRRPSLGESAILPTGRAAYVAEGLEGRTLLAVTLSALTDTPDPQTAGGTVSLFVTTNLSPNIERVNFYRETNGTPGLQPTGFVRDALLGSDTTGFNGYSHTFAVTAAMEGVTHTYHAQAVEAGTGALSNVVSTTNRTAPAIGSFAALPDPVVEGRSLTLRARDLVDPDGTITAVRFYRETNGTAGLQVPGDLLVGAGTPFPGSGGSIYDVAMPAPAFSSTPYVYYAQASDAAGPRGSAATAASTVLRIVVSSLDLRFSPDVVYQGQPTVLRAAYSTSTPTGSMVRVYREANGVAGLQVGGDLVVHEQPTDATAGQIRYDVVPATPGAYQHYVQATDPQGGLSNVAVVPTLTVLPDTSRPGLRADPEGPPPVSPRAFVTLSNRPRHSGNADANSPPGEEFDKAFDGNINTKFLSFTSVATLTVDYLGRSVLPLEILITAALDSPERDPYLARVLGSFAGGPLGVVGEHVFTQRFDRGQTQSFFVLPSQLFDTIVIELAALDPVIQVAEVRIGERPAPLADVRVYRESNGVAGLQPAGDRLLHVDATPAGGFDTATDELSPGTYTYYAQATTARGVPGEVSQITHTVLPPTGPVPTSAAALLDTIPLRFAFRFDADVGASLNTGDLRVTNRLTGAAVQVAGVVWEPTARTATFSLVTAPPPDGDYRATLLGDGVRAGGVPISVDVHVDWSLLRGDANRDRRVDFADLLVLASNYNTAGRTFGQGNFDYDMGGNVNFADLLLLAGRYNTTLPAVAPPRPDDRAARVAADVLA